MPSNIPNRLTLCVLDSAHGRGTISKQKTVLLQKEKTVG